ncbi:MAG: Bax inhibitor-1/YccA family protein [Bacillales bacterium]|nr:Bax inhibitor-1/YccA family protein [Bacillales bacterium]
MPFKTSNPLIKALKLKIDAIEKDKGEKQSLSDSVHLYGLYLSSIILVISAIVFLQTEMALPLIDLLIIAIVCFILSALMVGLSIRFPKLAILFSLLYSFFQGIALALLSLVLRERYNYIYQNSAVVYNPDSVVFMTVSETIIIDMFLVQVFYMIYKREVRNFWFIFLFLLAFVFVLSGGIIYYLSTYVAGYNFIPNILTSLVTSVFIIFFMVIYMEEERKIIQEGIPKKYDWVIALSALITPFWAIIDLFKFIFSHSTK